MTREIFSNSFSILKNKITYLTNKLRKRKKKLIISKLFLFKTKKLNYKFYNNNKKTLSILELDNKIKIIDKLIFVCKLSDDVVIMLTIKYICMLKIIKIIN